MVSYTFHRRDVLCGYFAYFLEAAVSDDNFMSSLPYLFLIATGIYVLAKIMYIEALSHANTFTSFYPFICLYLLR